MTPLTVHEYLIYDELKSFLKVESSLSNIYILMSYRECKPSLAYTVIPIHELVSVASEPPGEVPKWVGGLCLLFHCYLCCGFHVGSFFIP